MYDYFIKVKLTLNGYFPMIEVDAKVDRALKDEIWLNEVNLPTMKGSWLRGAEAICQGPYRLDGWHNNFSFGTRWRIQDV